MSMTGVVADVDGTISGVVVGVRDSSTTVGMTAGVAIVVVVVVVMLVVEDGVWIMSRVMVGVRDSSTKFIPTKSGVGMTGGVVVAVTGVLVTKPNNLGFLTAKASQSNLISNGASLLRTMTNPFTVALETIYLISALKISFSRTRVVVAGMVDVVSSLLVANSVVETSSKDIVACMTGFCRYSLSKITATSLVPEATIA